jgi:nicotinate-nucleotide pyrophosphorylase (carboxylating)
MDYNQQLEQLITNALAEDIGDGDHSTISSIDSTAQGKAILKIKEDGVLAGMEVAEKIFRHMQADIVFTVFKKDGDDMKYGEIAFEVKALVHTAMRKVGFKLYAAYERHSYTYQAIHTKAAALQNKIA